MTRKDYREAVKTIQNIDFSRPYNCTEFACVVDAFCKFFKADNPKFDRVKFEDACLKACSHENKHSLLKLMDLFK